MGHEQPDPGLVVIQRRRQAGHSHHGQAGEVFDSENGYESSPNTKLLPGRHVSFKVGFGVADPTDVVLQVTPSFEHADALFTS